MIDPIEKLNHQIISCERCPRLIKYCQNVALKKRRAYKNDEYWGKPVPGFGDTKAELMIVGLAPAAHGANRTGRIFTGDRSGEWLYRALHKAGFANQPTSAHRNDLLSLKGAYVSCALRCAPPGNQPLTSELQRCAPYLKDEISALKSVRVYLALGQIAMNAVWPLLAPPRTRRPRFSHCGLLKLSNKQSLLLSYHPSQQNTFTGRLTEEMFDAVLNQALELLSINN